MGQYVNHQLFVYTDFILALVPVVFRTVRICDFVNSARV